MVICMICANCGGTIHVNQPCEDCKISYDDMLNGISHEEIKRLFKKLDDAMKRHRDATLEASLLACELENSSFILPIHVMEDSLGFVLVESEKNKNFLAVFTDMEAYSRFDGDTTPTTNSFKRILDILDENISGIVINPFDEVSCALDKEYFEKFFK